MRYCFIYAYAIKSTIKKKAQAEMLLYKLQKFDTFIIFVALEIRFFNIFGIFENNNNNKTRKYKITN